MSYQVPSNPTSTDPTILSSFGTSKLISLGSEDPPICLHHQAASQSLILLCASGTIHILSKTLNHEQKTLKFAMKKVGKISLSYKFKKIPDQSSHLKLFPVADIAAFDERKVYMKQTD